MNKKKYRFGISTTVDYTVSIESILKHAADAGFSFLSLGANHKQSHFWDMERFKEIRDEAEELGIPIESLHIPFGEGFDLSYPDEAERRLAIANTVKYIERSYSYGIDSVIIHPHHYLKESKETALSRSRESLEEIIMQAPADIRLNIENLPDDRGSWICSGLLDHFDSGELGWCYDSSHENISGEPFHLLEKHYDRLAVTHLSDNMGEDDDHLIPGEGVIEWRRMRGIVDRKEALTDLLFEVGTGDRLAEPVEVFIRRAFKRALEYFG